MIKRPVLLDCLFLSVVVLLSVTLYLPHLGFYSDDWAFLAGMSAAPDQSLRSLWQSIYSPESRMRPMQMLVITGLYRLFGLRPMGYHLVNSVLLLSCVVLFYLVLRTLSLPRLLALAVPTIFGLLPHYSTTRFWLSAFQVNVCIAFYFLSLYADLRAAGAGRRALWAWKLLSLLSLIGSGLAYEIALPLFLLNPLLVWFQARQLPAASEINRLSRGRQVALLGSNALAVLLVLVFKRQATARLGPQADSAEYFYWIAVQAVSLHYGQYDYGLNLPRALALNYGQYGLGLPLVVSHLLYRYLDATNLLTAVVLGAMIFAYLFYALHSVGAELPDPLAMLKLGITGFVVFGLGYAIFLTNYNVQFTPTGIGNRTAMAAALGVALSLVGALGWVSARFAPTVIRRGFFCALIALLGMSGFVINNTIASFWITAYRQEQAILADIREYLPTLPAHTTLILDGICPYAGPAIVFESSWDLAGALQIIYHDNSLRADVVTPNLKVKEDGLSIALYETETLYPYQNLILYHLGRQTSYPIADAEAARRYFQQYNPDYGGGCAPGHEGHGVPIF